MNSYYAGLDVGKRCFDVSLINSEQQEVGFNQFTNNEDGFVKLLKWIKTFKIALSDVLFCAEDMGSYISDIALFSTRKKLQLALLCPLSLKRSLGIQRGKKVEKLIAIGSEWSATDLSGREQIFKEITPESAKGLFSGYYKNYQDMNPEPDFDRFTKSVVDMWCDKGKSGYPNESVKAIKTQLLLIRGDQDFLTSLESTVELHRIIENSHFLNVPFAEHVVYAEQKDICQRMIHQFLFEQHIDK